MLDPRSSPDAYEEFLAVLRRGGAIAYPAETMYGLGAIGPDRENEARLNRMKRRDPASPLIYLTDGWLRCASLCADPRGAGRALAERFWPGPLTIVLPRSDGNGTVAFRQPALPFVHRWIRDLDSLLSSTSANRSGEPPAFTERSVLHSFETELDAIVLDGDFTPRGAPSTIVRIEKSGYTILREGSIPEAQIHTT
ncbi:MAG: L-threonylcarbamoyladenylate synthase [Gemmatimonadetes bacterium]|nr:L-threonylcarbamoyladenylate synthase [Gemmatimonadota bacterium]